MPKIIQYLAKGFNNYNSFNTNHFHNKLALHNVDKVFPYLDKYIFEGEIIYKNIIKKYIFKNIDK